MSGGGGTAGIDVNSSSTGATTINLTATTASIVGNGAGAGLSITAAASASAVTNSGTISGGATGAGLTVANAQTLTSVTNSGTIMGLTAASGIGLTGTGAITTITNASTGAITAVTGAAISTGGASATSIVNSGTISASGAAGKGIALGGNLTGASGIVNSGTISGGTGAGVAIDIGANTITNGITNTGRITSGGDSATAYAITGAAATANITNSGTISVTGTSAVKAIYFSGVTSSNITNSGAIDTTGATNGTAIRMDAALTGSIVNSGTITATGTGSGVDLASSSTAVTNSGTITAVGSGDAVKVAGATTITNAATGKLVTATGAAIELAGAAAIPVTNSGLVQATGAGAGIMVSANSSGLITNSGTITASGGGAAISVTATATNTVSNSGTISNTSTGTAVNVATGLTFGALTNNGTGLITTGAGTGDTINIAGTGVIGTITNSGTISAATGHKAIVVGTGGTAMAIVNSGTITASSAADTAIDRSLNGTASTITNTGLIVGKVKLANTVDDILNVNGGSITGVVQSSTNNVGSVAFGLGSGGTYSTAADFGLVGTKLKVLNVNTGSVTANNNIYATTTTVASGASLILGSSGNTLGGTVANNGTFDLGTKTATVSSALNGTGVLKTTISGGSTGSHGYLTSTLGAGTDFSAMTITPTVSGIGVTNGATYVLSKATNNATGTVAGATITGATSLRSFALAAATAGGTDNNGIAYSANDLMLTATIKSAANVSGVDTSNVTSVNALTGYTGTDASLQALNVAVQNLTSSADINKAGAQLRPDATGGGVEASLGSTNQAVNMVSVRSDSVRVAESGGSGVSTGEALKGLGVWGQGFGTTASQNRRDNVDGYDAKTYGMALGADTKVSESVRVGLSGAYARTSVDDKGDRTGSGTNVNSYIGTLYANYSGSPWYLDGSLTVGYHDYDTTRVVSFSGASGIATANHSGMQYGARAEAGYPVPLGKMVTATPLVDVSYNRLNQSSYTETGTNPLTVESNATNSIRSGLGGKIGLDLGSLGGWNFRPGAKAVWHHEFSENAADSTSRFSAGGSSFTSPGVKMAQDSANLGLSLDVVSANNLTLTASYDAEVKDQYVSHTGLAQLRMDF